MSRYASFFRHPVIRCMWKIVYWSPATIFVGQFFGTIRTINGRSMQPTLNPDSSIRRDVGLFERQTVAARLYERGDIVMVKSPLNPKEDLVKRVIALEGDTVHTLPPFPQTRCIVPQGHVWLEGDESFHSGDSNRFGPVPAALVKARLVAIIWPPERMQGLTTLSEYPGKASKFARVIRNTVTFDSK